jgi:hypothetical protein
MSGSASRIDRTPSSGGPSAPEPPSALRVRLLEAVGLEALTAAEDGVPASPGTAGPGSWQEQLARTCDPRPLRLRPIFLSIANGFPPPVAMPAERNEPARDRQG